MWLTLLGRFWYVIPLILLTLAVDHYRHDAKDARNDLAVFKAETKSEGLAAELKYQKQSTDREKVSNAQISALQSSYADVSARYSGLRSTQAKGNAPSYQLPPIPNAARTTDAAARDNQLLSVLQYADQQTAQLMACQNWIRSQQAVR